MKKTYSLFLLLLTVNFAAKAVEVLQTDLAGRAYGEQLKNSTFEGDWESVTGTYKPLGGSTSTVKGTEPVGWSSFNTGNFSSFGRIACTNSQLVKSADLRPGTTGTVTAAVKATEALFEITANGNLTNGRIRADIGNMFSATSDAKNSTKSYNYTDTGDNQWNTPFTAKPDSITIWVKFSTNADDNYARLSVFLHGDINFQDAPSTSTFRDNVVGNITHEFTRDYVSEQPVWRRLTLPFSYSTYISYTDFSNVTKPDNAQSYNVANIDPKYILLSLTTNKKPADGSTSDYILVDDILMIYNPTLSLGTLSNTTLYGGSTINIPFTLDGTMSPYNLNQDPNMVIAELSDANGSFDNAVNLGQVQTNVSGEVTATIPNNLAGTSGYRIRVRSTNYPMTSNDNGTNLTIIGPYTITLPQTPIGYTIVSEVGSSSPVIHGQSYSFKVNVATSHNQSTPVVKVDGSVLSAVGGVYTISNVTTTHTITVENVVINKYSVTYTQPTGGTISIKNGDTDVTTSGTSVDYNSVLTITATPSAGYTFSSLKVNNANFTSGNTHTVTENVSITASFSLNTYTITYVDGKGTNPNPTTYNVTTPTITLNYLSELGYTFDGWFSDAAKTIPATPITQGTTGNKTFYAKWEIITYTINYNLDGGSNHGDNPATYDVTTPTITLADPTKNCHTFKGWFKESSHTTEVTTIDMGSTGDINLYAKWEEDVYTVIFKSSNTAWGTVDNEGTSNTVNCGNTIASTATITNTTNYEFVGWFDEDNNKLSENPAYTHTPDKSETITAKFNETGKFLISVSRNNIAYGSVTGGGTYDSGTSCTVTATANPGYKFVKWTVNSNEVSTDLSYSFTVAENRNLAANFVKITYNITYNNTAGISHSNRPTYDVETTTFSLADLTRTGYTFGGWFNADNAPVTQIAKGSTGDKTLWAKWIPKTYTITYNADGGTGADNSSYTIETPTLTLPTPTKTGYNFDGWFTNSGTTGTAVTEITVGSTGNKTLWAKWSLINYTITYHNVPSGVTNSNRTQYNINDLIGALSTLVQDYYTFDGWYADAGFTTPISSITGVMGNVDIYAKWTPITYTITYNPNNGESIANGNYNVETAVTLPTPTKTGYTFDGWFTNSGTTGTAVTQIAIGSHGNQTLWAKWSLATYTITYHNVDNLYNPNQATTSYTAESQTITLEPVEKELHTFEGWFTDEGFTNAITQIPAGSTGNLTLYAKLLPNQYIVSVSSNNAQGGIVSGNGTYGHGSTVTVTATPNNGYKFIGWTENKVFVMNAPASYTFTAEKARELVANFTGPLSVSDFAPEGIVAYAKDRQIFVRFTNDIDPEALIYLFDITGNLLHTKYCDSQEMSFNVSNIGLYFVQIGNRTIKVVVR